MQNFQDTLERRKRSFMCFFNLHDLHLMQSHTPQFCLTM